MEADAYVRFVEDFADIRPILDGARSYDTQGGRKALLREMLFKALGFERVEGSPVDYAVAIQ